MPTACFVSVGRSVEQALERVALADSLGLHSAFLTHIAGPDSLTMLAAYAMCTTQIRLGTGVVPIYSRTPATMAQTAATLDALSGGRFTLGLGVSHRVVVENWHGATIERPVSEMREYVAIVRAILRGEEPPLGEKFRTAFRLAGLEPRPSIPILLAALSPGMLRLAGEVADGVVLWLCNPQYIADVVVPTVHEGLARAGRDPAGFTIVAAVPGAVSDDRDGVYATMRRELLTYFGLPFYRAMLERSGFDEDLAAYDAASGDVEGMTAAISDRFLEALTAVGGPDDVQAGLERYRDAGATLPAIGPIGRTDFDATLRAAANANG